MEMTYCALKCEWFILVLSRRYQFLLQTESNSQRLWRSDIFIKFSHYFIIKKICWNVNFLDIKCESQITRYIKLRQFYLYMITNHSLSLRALQSERKMEKIKHSHNCKNWHSLGRKGSLFLSFLARCCTFYTCRQRSRWNMCLCWTPLWHTNT